MGMLRQDRLALDETLTDSLPCVCPLRSDLASCLAGLLFSFLPSGSYGHPFSTIGK